MDVGWPPAIRRLPSRLLRYAAWVLRRPRPGPDAGRPPLPKDLESQLCAAALGASANAMYITDRGGRILWINPAFTRLSGYRLADVLGKTPRILKSGRQPPTFYAELWRTISAGQAWRGRLVNRKKNGEIYDVEQTISPIVGAGGEVSHFFAVHEDIFERLQSERRLLHDAMFDPITDLPNWNLLRRRIIDAVARAKRSGRFMAVAGVGLRPASAGASAPGHDDALHADAVPRLVSAVRQTDLVARHGDGFVVVMEDLENPELAAVPVRRMLELLRHTVPGEGKANLSAHAGIAVYPGDDDSPEILLQHAQQARREARGRPPFRFFHSTI